MYRTALRTAGPSALRAARPTLASGTRRFASTAPPPQVKKKRGTWKGTFLRWGLAGGAVYFYNTSPIFADEEASHVGPAPPHFSDADLPTVDALIQEKRRQAAAAVPPPPVQNKEPEPKAIEGKPEEADKTFGSVEGKDEEKSGKPKATDAATAGAGPALEPGSPEALEHEASQQGAFNPETGEINWECPCLGGMADGPCGEEFKAAFSCFVYSKEEPKGMDCIDKFQHMQDCFRKYPEIYGAELADDEEDAGASDTPAKDATKDAGVEKEVVPSAKENAEVIPKEAVDATDANKEKKMSSYAEVASKGPKQSPEEAAAPQPPQIDPTTASSTASLIDVDTPSVHTVPSDFESQEIQTETQAARVEREEEQQARDEEAARERAEQELAAKKKAAASKASQARGWLTKQFQTVSEGGSAGAIAVANIVAVVGLSGWLGFKAWGLYDRGRFGWKEAGISLGVLGAVGAVEGVFANYFSKAKGKKSQ